MCKYRVRYFYSKGAFLVLVWTLLVTMVSFSTGKNVTNYAELCDYKFYNSEYGQFNIFPKWTIVLPVVLGMVGAVLSGWLADAKLGNYRIMKYSIILLFITSIGSSIVTLLPCSVFKYNVYTVAVIVCLGGSALLIAIVASTITALQLGLDQMPDASSSGITSFIAWYTFCIFAGVWISTLIENTQKNCFNKIIWHLQLTSLVSPICMTLVLVLDFILARKWLLIEPKSPQSFKTIYQVLKFAWKHKAPLNRSALTYWEEDVPSRMDLGKSRYGGPFTTEQVEDVKTILRLIPLCLTLWLLGSIPTVFLSPVPLVKGNSSCNDSLLQLFTYSSLWYGIVWTVFYEFVIYPLVRNKLPSILKRIGIISLLITISSVVILILQVLFQYHSDIKALDSAATVLELISSGLLLLLLLNNMLEFVCAQAPYNMRGEFGGWILFIIFSSISFLSIVPHPSLIANGIGSGLSVFGFVVYCLLAHWYKRRVRDEEYCTQRVVEEVYDRYLSAKYPANTEVNSNA